MNRRITTTIPTTTGERRQDGRAKRREEEPPLYPSVSMVYDIPVINVEQLFYNLSRQRKLQLKNADRSAYNNNNIINNKEYTDAGGNEKPYPSNNNNNYKHYTDPVGDEKPSYDSKERYYTSSSSSSSSSYDGGGKASAYGHPIKSEKGYYDSDPSSSSPPSKPMEVEVFPGVFMMLRGSEETWQAVQANHICKADCICCDTSLYCIRDADFVLCPDCRAISPVYSGGGANGSTDDNKMRNMKQQQVGGGGGGGVGLGFTPQDLVNWQSEPYFAY